MTLKSLVFGKKEPSELELIRACQKGQENYIRLLYEKNYSLFYKICFRYCPDTDEVKDVIQDGFIRLIKNINQYEFKGSFEGWMKRVMVTTALNHLQSTKKHHLNISFQDAENVSEIMDENLIAYEKVISRFNYQDIIALIESLPDAYGLVFKLKVIEGYNHREIGEMLNISELNSRSILNKARKKLQESLKKTAEQEALMNYETTRVI